jgi:hypothetical protein
VGFGNSCGNELSQSSKKLFLSFVGGYDGVRVRCVSVITAEFEYWGQRFISFFVGFTVDWSPLASFFLFFVVDSKAVFRWYRPINSESSIGDRLCNSPL